MQKKVYLGIRIITGLMLVIFGSNKFFGFIEMQPSSLQMSVFVTALFQSGYLMTLVAVIEIAAGLSFLTDKYTALMAVVLMPVALNAFLAHVFLDPPGTGGAAVLLVFTVLIMIENREKYKGMFKA